MVRMVEQDGQLRCIFDSSLNTIACLELEKELLGRIREAKLPVVFDLARVDFIASAFLRICLTVLKEVGADHLTMANLKPSVQTVFKIAGFSDLIKGI